MKNSQIAWLIIYSKRVVGTSTQVHVSVVVGCIAVVVVIVDGVGRTRRYVNECVHTQKARSEQCGHEFEILVSFRSLPILSIAFRMFGCSVCVVHCACYYYMHRLLYSSRKKCWKQEWHCIFNVFVYLRRYFQSKWQSADLRSFFQRWCCCCCFPSQTNVCAFDFDFIWVLFLLDCHTNSSQRKIITIQNSINFRVGIEQMCTSSRARTIMMSHYWMKRLPAI